MRFVKFNGADRDYSWCSFFFKPEPGAEAVLTLGGQYMDYSDRQILLSRLSLGGLVADLDDYSGLIYVLIDRFPEKK